MHGQTQTYVDTHTHIHRDIRIAAKFRCVHSKGVTSVCRFLTNLTSEFSKCVDTFIDSLKPLADGHTVVDLKEHFDDLTLDVVSKASCAA